jgi:putative addiction module killer protein
MFEVHKTLFFDSWFNCLKDKQARVRIDMRIKRLQQGNLGDSKVVGESVHELRIPYGPGYRVYFTNASGRIVILLCRGDKSTQQADIERAKKLAREQE